jgi:hypothetical protein
MGGASNYTGDLAPGLRYRESHPAVGVLGRINISNYFAMKANILHGKITGNDQNFVHNMRRNLNFQSNVSELSVQFEFNFFRYGMGPLCKRFSPYVITGLSAFHFNPQTMYRDNLVDLQPLGTEGQFLNGGRHSYSRVSFAVPIGGGVKYDLDNNWIIGFETGFRTTFTDYLDDVSKTYPDLVEMNLQGQRAGAELSDRSYEFLSLGEPLSSPGDQRGNSLNKDWYIFSVATLSYRITKISCGKFQKKLPKARRRFDID